MDLRELHELKSACELDIAKSLRYLLSKVNESGPLGEVSISLDMRTSTHREYLAGQVERSSIHLLGVNITVTFGS